MNSLSSSKIPVGYFLLIYLFLWIVLFEFVLPVNKFLPKPSIVVESIVDLITKYNLLYHLVSSVVVIYFSMLFSYLLIAAMRSALIKKKNILTDFIMSLEWFSEYVPGIAIGLILIYWFPDSNYIEFIFAFAASFTSLLIRLQKLTSKAPESYSLAARSLGMKEDKINSKIIWKAVQPNLTEHLISLHFYLWSMLIAFEYIKGGLGVGVVFRDALSFNDLSALFSTFILIGLTIFAGQFFLKKIKEKYFNWSVD